MIQIVEKPYLYPQRCFFTGSAAEQPILDTGREDTVGGRVYISLSFFDELARTAGYITREEASELSEENAFLRAQVAELPLVIERTADAVRSLASSAQFDLLSLVADRLAPVDEDDPEGGSDAEGSAGRADAPAGK